MMYYGFPMLNYFSCDLWWFSLKGVEQLSWWVSVFLLVSTNPTEGLKPIMNYVFPLTINQH